MRNILWSRSHSYTANPLNNRIAGYTYEKAGNVTNDGTNTYYWDGESHLITWGEKVSGPEKGT